MMDKIRRSKALSENQWKRIAVDRSLRLDVNEAGQCVITEVHGRGRSATALTPAQAFAALEAK